MTVITIALVGLDWGSSQLRAYAFDANGRVVAKRNSAAGAMKLQSPQAFREALYELVDQDAQWCRAPRIACGMVGARGAWVEAGYCAVGADVAQIAEHLSVIEFSDVPPLWVVPGIASLAPDVMRGEETQLLGAGITDGVVVLPGTHSKWAVISGGTIASFTTYFTGEMNALIRTQSTVGRVLSQNAQINDAALDRGIAMARSQMSWLTTLFSFRARAVAQGADAQLLSNEFSAWLIATELLHALPETRMYREIFIVGSEQLSDWYAAIAQRLDVPAHKLDSDQCVTAGLWRLALAKALV
ncbi:MAG: 2-dehydro-3-deoxygalactonokinase [Burkholderiales bacterium]|nr:MAG: 2-dehydro-3-deoxygalactonokinase [Burkholderiales bacterium]TAG77572.1 MAG: 2-dehydro-3-deoxygalactonokinase [Betaproteobacteria bacterium]